MNSAFRQLFDLGTDLKPDRQIEDYVPDKGFCDLVKDIYQGKYIDHNDIPDYEFVLSDKKYLLAKAQPVLDGKQKCLGTVVNVIDISNMKVLDQLKSEFVAKVSHELRSPLSTIHEQLALVIKNMAEDPSTNDRHLLSRAKEKTQGLISLIGDLLDLSRIAEGIICHDPKPVNIEEILKNIIDFLESRAKAKKHSLTLEYPRNPLPLLVADPIALESILGNLITNAINYTQDGGKITVKADLAGMKIRVQVIDNGFGIKKKHLKKIFDRFYRVKNDKTRYITGTGLGLTIVKELTKSLGGFIEVESNPNQGSTFTVFLPVK
jgi:signal transduction histidine kinase